MDERKSLIQWIKDHKKELIIAGISIGTLILIILRIKNRALINDVWDSLKEVVKHPSVKCKEKIVKVMAEVPTEPIQEIVPVVPSSLTNLPIEVRTHIRNLHEGWHASPEKIAEALKNNIILMDGQTWVDSYIKGSVAA